tara:strand:+ start:18026 stop:19804 length:1779 start_codon:yes stop_codon:yes gene_type:complete
VTNSPSDLEERFTELWTDYLEGDLEEAGMVELRNMLADHKDLLKQAFDLYQTHRLLGFIAIEEPLDNNRFIRETMARLPEDGDTFARKVMEKLDSQQPASSSAISQGSTHNTKQTDRKLIGGSGWIVAAILIIALPIVWFSANNQSNVPVAEDIQKSRGDVHFKNISQAQFFGELPPRAQSLLTQRRDYVLLSGLVELAFPQGASAIIEGPAVFRVLSDECLALDVGQCSVHAPDGAEGFRIETPVTRVVDRGTRFVVNVSETSETEVHVIEGIADIYRNSTEQFPKQATGQNKKRLTEIPDNRTFELRLNNQEACRLNEDESFLVEPTKFNPSIYRSNLPDRVISYNATKGADGRAELLRDVTVQRGDKVLQYPVEKIIPVEVTYFKAAPGLDRNGHIAGGPSLSNPRADFLADTALNTGIINPGGSQTSLVSNPVLQHREGDEQEATPGIALKFQTPVKNGPGPDIVFFELQTFSNPPEGDAFHVSPMKFTAGRKSHTIQAYDLSISSPECLELTQFHLYPFKKQVASLHDLQTAECAGKPIRLKFWVLAVGIDLSSLGYLPGEEIEEIFIQDAQDDQNIVDPVFVGGLP